LVAILAIFIAMTRTQGQKTRKDPLYPSISKPGSAMQKIEEIE